MPDPLSFVSTFGKPRKGQLSRWQRRISRRDPPIERAQEVFGYDSDVNSLFYLAVEGRDEEYVELGAPSALLDGVRYPCWKLKSAVLLGTLDGRPANAAELEALLERLKPPKPLSPPEGVLRKRAKMLANAKPNSRIKAKMSYVQQRREAKRRANPTLVAMARIPFPADEFMPPRQPCPYCGCKRVVLGATNNINSGAFAELFCAHEHDPNFMDNRCGRHLQWVSIRQVVETYDHNPQRFRSIGDNGYSGR